MEGGDRGDLRKSLYLCLAKIMMKERCSLSSITRFKNDPRQTMHESVHMEKNSHRKTLIHK